MEYFYNFYVFVHPIFPSPQFSVIPPEAIFGAIFGIYLLCKLPFPRHRPTYSMQKVFFYLFIWLWVADLITLIRIQSFDEIRHVAGRTLFFIFVLMAHYTVVTPERYLKVLRCLMWGVLSLAAFTTFCALTGFDPFRLMPKNPRTFWGVSMGVRRTQGIPMSYGEYGLILNAVLPLFLVSLWKRDFFIRSRAWVFCGLFVLALGLFVSQSRNSWLATFFVFNFFGMWWISKSRNPALKGTVITGALVFSILTFLALSDYFSFLWEGFALGRQSGTFYNRLESDKIAWALFMTNPVFGVGHEAITNAIAQVRGLDVVVHNGYMDQLAGCGLFGFIPFLCIQLFTLSKLLRMSISGPSPWRFFALCLTASLIANMSLLLGYKGFFSDTFAVEYGLALSLVELWEKGKVGAVYESQNMPSDYYLLQPGR